LNVAATPKINHKSVVRQHRRGGGFGLPIIGKLVGHMEAATTRRYAHLEADPILRAADAITATIAAPLNGGGAAKVAASRATQCDDTRSRNQCPAQAVSE
jgi:hypothetical protein